MLSGVGGELMDHRRRQEMKGQTSVLALDKGKNKNERTILSSSNNINWRNERHHNLSPHTTRAPIKGRGSPLALHVPLSLSSSRKNHPNPPHLEVISLHYKTINTHLRWSYDHIDLSTWPFKISVRKLLLNPWDGGRGSSHRNFG